MKVRIIYLLLLFLLSGCLGFDIEEKVVGNYYLVAADAPEQLSLSYHEPADGDIYGTIIDGTVFAVGYNEKYIIVKQHPWTFPNQTNNGVTNYFILPLSKGFNWKTNNGLIGPLTLEQFNEKRKALNIPESLSFTNVKANLK
jgi:hypothetical protein